MTIDVDKLRAITANAVAEIQRIAQAKVDEAERKRQETLAEHKRIADNIIAKIPTMCEKAASEGQNEVKVMRLVHDRDYLDNPKLWTVRGVGALVKDYLESIRNLNFRIEPWHDGVGIDGGYDIYVSW